MQIDNLEWGNGYTSRTGMSFRAGADGHYIIDHVEKGSAAEKAGLRNGYTILSVWPEEWWEKLYSADSFESAGELGNVLDSIFENIVVFARLPDSPEERFVIRQSSQVLQDRMKGITNGIIDLSEIDWRKVGFNTALAGSTMSLLWLTGLMYYHGWHKDGSTEGINLPWTPTEPSITDTRPAPQAVAPGMQVSPDMRTVTIPRPPKEASRPTAQTTQPTKRPERQEAPNIEQPKATPPVLVSKVVPPEVAIAKIKAQPYVQPKVNPWNADNQIARQVYSPASPDFQDPFNKSKKKKRKIAEIPAIDPTSSPTSGDSMEKQEKGGGGGSKKCPPEKPTNPETAAPKNTEETAPKTAPTELESNGNTPAPSEQEKGEVKEGQGETAENNPETAKSEAAENCAPWTNNAISPEAPEANTPPITASEASGKINIAFVGSARIKQAERLVDILTKMGKGPDEIRETLSRMIQESGLDHTHPDGIGHVTGITRTDMIERPGRYAAHIQMDDARMNSLFPGENYAALRAAIKNAQSAKNKQELARHMSTILGHYNDNVGVQVLVSEAVIAEKSTANARPEKRVRSEALNILVQHKNTIGYALARSMGPSVSDDHINAALDSIAEQVASGEKAIIEKLHALSAYNVGHASANGIPYAIITLARAKLLGK